MDYIARIEIDGELREVDRAKLHTELAKSQLYFIVMGIDGVTGFQLPPGTYYCYETYPDINAAHRAVSSAISRTSLTGRFFVAAVTGWQSSNLLTVVPK